MKIEPEKEWFNFQSLKMRFHTSEWQFILKVLEIKVLCICIKHNFPSISIWWS